MKRETKQTTREIKMKTKKNKNPKITTYFCTLRSRRRPWHKWIGKKYFATKQGAALSKNASPPNFTAAAIGEVAAV